MTRIEELVAAHERGEVVVTFGPGSALHDRPKQAGDVILTAAAISLELPPGSTHLTENAQALLVTLSRTLAALYPLKGDGVSLNVQKCGKLCRPSGEPYAFYCEKPCTHVAGDDCGRSEKGGRS